MDDRRNTCYGKVPGMDQAPCGVETALVPLWSLMRFLNLRLKPKAAARPRIGRGPGTDAEPELLPTIGTVSV